MVKSDVEKLADNELASRGRVLVDPGPAMKPSDDMARVLALCGTNPGAVRVVSQMLGVIGEEFLEALELIDLRGSEIWVAFKDKCGEDHKKFLCHVLDLVPDWMAEKLIDKCVRNSEALNGCRIKTWLDGVVK